MVTLSIDVASSTRDHATTSQITRRYTDRWAPERLWLTYETFIMALVVVFILVVGGAIATARWDSEVITKPSAACSTVSQALAYHFTPLRPSGSNLALSVTPARSFSC